MRRSMGAVCSALAACAIVALTQVAFADPAAGEGKEVAGLVISLDGDDLIIDLGKSQVSDGATVELWRPISLKHPVTGKVFSDRFRIGTLTVSQARAAMSLARATGELERAPQKGDVVIVAEAPPKGEKASSAPAAEEPKCAQAAPAGATPDDLEARAVAQMIESLKGADLATRIVKYEDFVRIKPKSRFAVTLYEEALALRRLMAPARSAMSSVEGTPKVVLFSHPKVALENKPFQLGVELDGAASGAVLHVRHRYEPAYRSYPMAPEGPGYFSTVIPASEMSAGSLEYFVEGTTPSGKAFQVVGESQEPNRLSVEDVPKSEAPRRLDTTVSVLSDYADYNRFRGNDRIWQTEGYFGVRFGDRGIRALRTGFGVYRGASGAVAELDELNMAPRKVGLTYGYLEGEIGIVKDFSLIARAAVGLLDAGVGGGGQFQVRIGSDLRTNLVVGGEILGGVGLKSFAELDLESFERFPIVLRTEVTNQPAGSQALADPKVPNVSLGSGDIGARAIAQLGFRPVRSFTISARGSFQGRNIKHAGPGFGGGVTYQW